MSHHLNENLLFSNESLGEQSDFANISCEIIPKIKSLISLCAEQGLFIKILSRATVIRKYLVENLDFDLTGADEATADLSSHINHNFGLAFGVGIYECSASGGLKYLDHQLLYDRVAKIGESLGLTWAGHRPHLPKLRYFELRPTWANEMSENEMMDELWRRKDARLSLLA